MKDGKEEGGKTLHKRQVRGMNGHSWNGVTRSGSQIGEDCE